MTFLGTGERTNEGTPQSDARFEVAWLIPGRGSPHPETPASELSYRVMIQEKAYPGQLKEGPERFLNRPLQEVATDS